MNGSPPNGSRPPSINDAIVDHNFAIDGDPVAGGAYPPSDHDQPFVHDLQNQDFVLVNDDKSKLKKRKLVIAICAVLAIGGAAITLIQATGSGTQKPDDFAFAKPPLTPPVQSAPPAALMPPEGEKPSGQDGAPQDAPQTAPLGAPLHGAQPGTAASSPASLATPPAQADAHAPATPAATAPTVSTPAPAAAAVPAATPASAPVASPAATAPTKPAAQPLAQKPAPAPAPAQPAKPAPAAQAAKQAPVAQPKPAAAPTQAAQPAKPKPEVAAAGAGQGSAGDVKPLVTVSAAEIGLRFFTPDSISVSASKDTSPQMYRVGDMLPSGERIQHLDAGAMTIVTSRRVIKIK